MARLSLLLLLMLGSLRVGARAAPLSGVVRAADGRPVAGALVRGCGSETKTEADGRFRIETDLPCELAALHAAFERLDLLVKSQPEKPIELILVSRPYREETIVVTASRRRERLGRTTSAVTVAEPERAASPPSSPTALLADTPSVSENGQGGRFQTISVRGIGKQRVYSLLDGMRVVTDRRAGTSISFFDPLLLDRAEVVRGPTSTLYGSGALGGAVQLFTKSEKGLAVTADLAESGLAGSLGATYGNDLISIGLAARASADTEDANGGRLNTHFRQASGFFRATIPWAGKRLTMTLVPAYASDIGKSNSRFPRKRTEYPLEKHLLVKLGLVADSYESFIYLHPNELQTETTTEGSPPSVVLNRATDLGGSFLYHIVPGDRTRLDLGFDYFGRRSVEATESTEFDATSAETLKDGVEDEAALFAAAEFRPTGLILHLGLRATGHRQQAKGHESKRRGSLDGFASLGWPVADRLILFANLATGTRNPSLSERFFSGTTGRGTVTGNPELLPERSLNAEVGLRRAGDSYLAELFLFRNQIDRYIEKIETSQDHYTFQNVQSGTISGIEAELHVRPRSSLELGLSGHLLRGTIDASGQPLSDIPPARLSLSLNSRFSRFVFATKWRHDFAFRHPGSGESKLGAADWLEASILHDFSNGIGARIYGTNLLDQAKRTSPDNRAPLATGRSVGLVLSFRTR